MTFQFSSFNDFLWMSGHGPYVWACFILTFGGLKIFLLKTFIELRQFKKNQMAVVKRQIQSSQGHL